MKLFWITLAVLSLSVYSDDKQAITETLNYYMEGSMNRDFDTLKKAFHEQAIMTINRDGKLEQVNAREFFSKMTPGTPHKRNNEIVSMDIVGHTAFARLKIEDDEKVFHDFMTLQKIDGRWYIVNKSFYLERK